MRGDDPKPGDLFSYLSPEQRVPADHPLRPMRQMVDAVLGRLSPRFDGLYSDMGRPSIAPEQLLRALLLQVFYSVRSERLLMEQLDYNLLFRWFVVWRWTRRCGTTRCSARTGSGCWRRRSRRRFSRVLRQRGVHELLSDEHFTVDGTLLEAWASQKSFRPKDAAEPPPDDSGESDVNFHGEAAEERHASVHHRSGRAAV